MPDHPEPQQRDRRSRGPGSPPSPTTAARRAATARPARRRSAPCPRSGRRSCRTGDQPAAAGQLAVEPVGERGEREHAARGEPPRRCRSPPSTSSMARNTGTSSSRSSGQQVGDVRAVAAAVGAADRSLRAGSRRPARRPAARPSRSTPELLDHSCRRRRRTGDRRRAGAADEPALAVHLGRLVLGPPDRTRVPSSSRHAVDEHSTSVPIRSSARCAMSSSTSALIRSHPVADLRRATLPASRRPRCRPRRSSRTRRPRPAAPRSGTRSSSARSASVSPGKPTITLLRMPASGASARIRSHSSRKRAAEPNRRIRRSTGSLACWKDRSKYGATPVGAGDHLEQLRPDLGGLQVADPDPGDPRHGGQPRQQPVQRAPVAEVLAVRGGVLADQHQLADALLGQPCRPRRAPPPAAGRRTRRGRTGSRRTSSAGRTRRPASAAPPARCRGGAGRCPAPSRGPGSVTASASAASARCTGEIGSSVRRSRGDVGRQPGARRGRRPSRSARSG